MEQRPIAITGMHRTGTSMVTRALHDSGLHLLGTGAEAFIDAAEDNPEGFWENAAIVACNDDLLEATGGAWDNPPEHLPFGADDPRVAHLNDAARAALDGLREHDHWGFKDPRTCLTAGYWLDLEPELRFVICLRHPLEVALSLKRRNQNSYSLGLALWERYYGTVIASVPRERRIVTHYDSFFTDPAGELARLCEFAGLEPSEPRVRADLRHHDIDVTLTDANVSPSLRALYDDLCIEAGVAPPTEESSDEGRVRRLILDGSVARRHADQRQDAIERLEERLVESHEDARRREAEARKREADTEARLRTRIRELEGQIGTVRQVADAVARNHSTLQRTEAKLQEIDQRTRHTERRVEVAVQAVKPGRARRAMKRWTKRAIGYGKRGRKAAVPRAKSAVRHLPPPAKDALKKGRTVAKRGQRAAVPRARAAAKRLPPPARDALRRGSKAVRRARPARASSRPASGRSAPRAPKGAVPKDWARGFDALVATVPAGSSWLVVTPGSPESVRSAGAQPPTAFPQASNGTAPGVPRLVQRLTGADRTVGVDLSHIANLESLRYAGHRYLVVPAPSRPWFGAQVALREHVTGRYLRIADSDAGSVFDLERPAVAGMRSLRAEVAECAGGPDAPAVLDWTDLDVAGELPGLTTFQAPPGDRLPYLDSSVVIVVVDDAHDHDEAVRVASGAVITVAAGPAGPVAVAAHHVSNGNGRAAASRRGRVVLVSADPNDDERWRTALARVAADAGAEVRCGVIDADSLGAVSADDVVVVVEPAVLPLPGALTAAAALVAADPGSVHAGKVLRADGRLEAAGGTVFFDRSVALIGHGSADVHAPWHEFVRPVCWAPGIVAASGARWLDIARPAHVTGRAFLREWCSEAWASGHRVLYQPTITAVRVAGDGNEPEFPLEHSAWQRVLDHRPRRPRDLGDGDWRYLLAHDDVESCLGEQGLR